MKKITLFFSILGVVFLAGCGSNTSLDEELTNETTQETGTLIDQSVSDNDQANISEETIVTTMNELFKKGGPATCTFDLITEDGVPFSGLVYIDGKKMKYTSKGMIEGNMFEVSVIVRDGYSYSWSNIETKGYKMKEVLETDSQEDMSAEERDQEMEYTCKKGVQEGVFDLPSTVEFVEMTE